MEGKAENVTEPGTKFGGNAVPVIKMVSAAKAFDIDSVISALGTK